MEVYGKFYFWHPRFRIETIYNKDILLVSEAGQFLLAGPRYQPLITLIDSPRTHSQIVARIENPMQQFMMMQTMESLLKQGILVEGLPLEDYKIPAFKMVELAPIELSPFVSLYNLSEFDGLSLITELTNHLRLEHKLNLVIVDDYLDPRLEALNDTFRNSAESWLLLKISGEQPIFGPLFTPDIEATPCWHCLSHQMLENQPVRRYLQYKNCQDFFALPVLMPEQRIEATLPQITECLDKLLQSKNHSLYTVNNSDAAPAKHQAIHRPHCPSCGNPKLMNWQTSAPVTLENCIKTYDIDGGSRSVTPEQTVASISPFISPVSGFINQISELPKPADTPITIYRTSFFKTPFSADKLTNNDFVQVSLGKGVGDMQSQASGLCESVERYAALYQGDETAVYAEYDKRQKVSYLPQQLAPYSQAQYASFTAPEFPESLSKHSAKPFNMEKAIHWSPVWSLTHDETRYLPFSYCYANTPYDDVQYSRWGSNGCAAGNTLEEAILQGYFELIERDATAIWWYNKVQRPQVDLSELPEGNLQRIRQTLDKEWDYWVLDISHDFKVPVMAAISQHKETGKFSLGFGCHLSASLAAQRALTELCQLIPIREQNAAPFDFNAIQDEAYLYPREEHKPVPLQDYCAFTSDDIKDDIQFLVGQADRLGMETLVLNYSRPHLPIKTAKVIVPGLCHIWPQLGNQRLYQVPVSLGWYSATKTEQSINRQALYI